MFLFVSILNFLQIFKDHTLNPLNKLLGQTTKHCKILKQQNQTSSVLKLFQVQNFDHTMPVTATFSAQSYNKLSEKEQMCRQEDYKVFTATLSAFSILG